MAAKTLYLLDSLVSGANHLALQDGGSAPAAATGATGWTVGSGLGADIYSAMDSMLERAEATFGAPEPTTIDQTLGNCFRSQNQLNGFFQAGTWTFDLPVIAVTSGGDQDGRIRVRVFRSALPDATSAIAVLLSGGSSLVGSGVTNLATGTPQTSSITWIPGQALFFNNEYLYVLIIWERTGAGGAADRDVLLRVGSAAKIVTADFVASGLAKLTANVNRAIDPNDSDVLDVQQNVFPQDAILQKHVPQGFLVIPKVVRVVPTSLLWTTSGTWTSVNTSGFIEGTSGDGSVTTNNFKEITIRARAFRLAFAGTTDRGIATITIDGVSPSTISGLTMEDGSAAQDTIDTYRAALTHRIFSGYKGLSAASHVVRVTVSGTKNAASTGFRIELYGIEYVDILADAADGVACNQVLVLPYGDLDDLVDPTDTALTTYVGTWSNTTDSGSWFGQYRQSITAADYFEIAFTGTGIVIFFAGAVSGGFLDITVDGALVAKRWTLYMPTNTHRIYPFPILGLSNGSHTVRVAVNADNENGANNSIFHVGYFVVKPVHTNGYGGVLVTAENRWNKTGLDSVTMLAMDASNPRKDLLVVSKAGVFSIIQGTAAASPADPADPTDDRVPLAILIQEKSGILLQRLHPENFTTDTPDKATMLVQVKDRRPGIPSAFGELPVALLIPDRDVIQTGDVTARFRLPARTRRVRCRKLGALAADRVAIVVSGSSPQIRRELDDSATSVEAFINVNGLAGKVVHGQIILSGTGGCLFELQSVT